jgi:hypothetical protein
MFAGRDVSFYGSMFGTNSEINTYLAALDVSCSGLIEAGGLVSMQTPYADMGIYIKNILVERFHGAASVQINFRDTIPILTGGTLPATGANNNQIDGIPLSSFGLYLSKSTDLYSLPELKDAHFTEYGYEGWVVPSPKRKSKTLSLNGFIAGTSLTDFQSKIKALYKVFSSAGTRAIKINNEVSVVCFATEGFKVSNVLLYTTGMIANFDMKLTVISVTYL